LKIRASNLDSFAQFTVNSLSRISPSRKLFDALSTKYDVTPRLKEFVMSFGFKRRENDFGPPTLRFRFVRTSETNKSQWSGGLDGYKSSFECVYGFRYAFNTNKDPTETSPWSVRQTTVYQKFDAKANSAVWIFIGASDETKDIVREIVERRSSGRKMNAFLLHAMIIENSLGEWRWYISDLAERVNSMVRS
jgi:hypothetical protein